MTRLSGETALGLAWTIALTASLAVLFIGEVLGQTPCVLCWFQRAFMFPLAIVLGLGLWWQDPRVGRYGVALALGGAAVALYHIGLYVGLIPEAIPPCTATGQISTLRGNRSRRRCRISRITAPEGEVTTPITSGR